MLSITSNLAHLFDFRPYLTELQAGKRRTTMTSRSTMYVLGAIVLSLTTLQTGVSGEVGLIRAFRIHRQTIQCFTSRIKNILHSLEYIKFLYNSVLTITMQDSKRGH